MFLKRSRDLKQIRRYLRLADYIGAASLYLQDNFFMESFLKKEHIKPRVLGHWGTVPGLNFIYAHANRLARDHELEMMFVTGPGHGAPAILANLLIEGTLAKFYPEYTPNKEGMAKLIKDFSWPHTPFPSHVTPSVPGSILEGGELGYSLGTAYGAVLDNPNLIATVVIGDGEAETGPISAAWHSNKFLNPVTSGAVLPVVHINGYKISNPTLFGRMDDEELKLLFQGYGYEPIFVRSSSAQMYDAMDKAYKMIRGIQAKARSGKKIEKPRWPVILLRTPKGWHGLEDFQGYPIEGSFRAHGVPIDGLKNHESHCLAVGLWLQSYKVQDLFAKDGSFSKDVLTLLPKKVLGQCAHANGGAVRKSFKQPSLKKLAIPVDKKQRGALKASSTVLGGQWMREAYRLNKNNFRLMCPDEIVSNKLDAVFQVTKRAFMWPLNPNDEEMSVDGRVMEVLSEHSLQAWLQGYLLTGRYGMFISYEAFTTIITSMVDQYAKFLKQMQKVAWRKPVGPAVYLNTSVGWRQDHNGYSHQNPSFVSNVLAKHGEFTQVYYPADANSFLVALEEVYGLTNSIAVMVAGKRDLPQWLTLDEARAQAKVGMGIWDFVTSSESAKKPDVVLASAGDYMTEEAIKAARYLAEKAPEIKLRFVNVSEMNALSLGERGHHAKKKTNQADFEKFFTKDKPVVFVYHGYTSDVENILWPYHCSDRVSIHGYQERGSTTTPFDLKVLNEVSFYHLAIDVLQQVLKKNAKHAKKYQALISELRKGIRQHHTYIISHGEDPAELESIHW